MQRTTTMTAKVEERVRENVGELDEERRDENEAVEMTQERLERLSKAFLNFAFLSSAISNPVKIDMQSQQSHFVMYNKARLSRLQATFDEQVNRGVYPPVPTDLEQINFSLLIEPEEWELVWGHLMGGGSDQPLLEGAQPPQAGTLA